MCGPRGIAEELAARLAGHERVPGDVGRQQPEIDDRMAQKPEESAREERVGAVHETELTTG